MSKRIESYMERTRHLMNCLQNNGQMGMYDIICRVADKMGKNAISGVLEKGIEKQLKQLKYAGIVEIEDRGEARRDHPRYLVEMKEKYKEVEHPESGTSCKELRRSKI